MAALAVMSCLSACAGIEPGGDGPSRSKPHIIVDNLDITMMNTVLTRGFGEIKDRALDEPDLDNLFITGMAGLTSIDPDLQVMPRRNRIVLKYAERDVADLGPVPKSGMGGWSLTTLQAVLAGRKVSPLLQAADDEEIYKAVFAGALTLLDPFSRYSGRRDAARNRLVRDGVIGLGVRVEMTDAGALIVAIVNGGPGETAGLMLNDTITKADELPLARQPLNNVRRRLDGTAGSPITLTVQRADAPEPLVITATRDLIVPDTVASQTTDGVAVIRIRSFNQRTAIAVEKAVSTARGDSGGKLKGIVLDLRGDPGGLLDQAIDTADLFLDSGIISTLHGRHAGAQQYYVARAGDIAAGIPMAVVIDGKSASAAEIVAAALQDNRRAAVVGTVSWGKGSVQTVQRLPNGGELALTWARALAPRGTALHGLGVLPDVCTSGESDVPGHWIFASGHPTLEERRLWRAPHDDAAAHEALRSRCPAEPHPDREGDLEIARRIAGDPALMARAMHDDSSQLAVKP